MSKTPKTIEDNKNEMVHVDITKVDYTIRDWDDTKDLIDEIYDYHSDPDRIVNAIQSHGEGLRPIVHIKGRTHGNSRVHVRLHGAEPYFYVPRSQYDSEIEENTEVTRVERGHEDIHGNQMVKVCTRIPGDVPKLRSGYDHYEADILFPNRVMIDIGIEGAAKIPAEHVSPDPTDVLEEDLKESNYNTRSRVCFCDIEVYDKDGFPDQERAEREVTSITVYDNYRDDYVVFFYHPDTPIVGHEQAEVRVYDNEARMLKSFCEYILDRDFDVITGWNFSDFDARYLVNRLDVISNNQSQVPIDKKDISDLGSAYDDGYFGAKIKGMAVLDLLSAYQNLQFSELDSYSLDDVAQAELGTGKITDNRDLYELWENEPQKLVDYNFKDVKLTVRLNQEQAIINFYEEVANYVGGRLAECVDASKAVDIKILRAVNGSYAVPSSKTVDGETFEGAQVFDPITGVKENVIVLDLASLYPMSMKTINAGPETKAPDGELVAPNDVRFTKDKDAIVVEIIDEMLEERQKYKDLRDKHNPDSKQYGIYDRKQTAVKVIMNTLYGVLGWDRFRLYDEDVGAAVTAVGREVIRFTEQVVEDMGYEVTYGDTDSVMVELGEIDYSILSNKEIVQTVLDVHEKDSVSEFREYVENTHGEMTDEQFKRHFATLCIGFNFEKSINDRYDDFAKDELNADEHWFDIEFEKLYRRYFQAGKKKRYAGKIVWKEGKEKHDVDTVGFETERSDYSEAAKDILEEVLGIIVSGGKLDEVSRFVREEIEKLKNGEYKANEWGIPASVTKNFDDYDSPTTAVRGSVYANDQLDAGIQPGDKPKKGFIKRIHPDEDGNIPYDSPPSTGDGDMFVCWMNFEDMPDEFEWDWDTYIDKQIKGPIKRVLAGTDWTWSEVISGNRQPRLGEYSFDDETKKNGTVEHTFADPTDGEDDKPTIDDEWEREELEARKKLSKAQNVLGNWESDENEKEDSEEVDMVVLDDGPSTLDDFL
jgi:DNA polymerase I